MIDIKNLKINLENIIPLCEKVIIVPHKFADFDAIGSAIGLSLLARKFKKPSYIIDNDPLDKMEAGVKIIVDETSKEFNIINRDKYLNLSLNDNNLFILTDVNKKYLIYLEDLINNPDKTFILDHHEADNNTLESNYKYIDPSASSASEIVTKLLSLSKIKIPSNVAKYLLAGIYLDTNKLTKNVTSETMKMVAKLLESGAVMSDVINLFKEDYYSDRRVQELVSKIKMFNYSLAVIVANNEDEYSREELAKAADYALKYGCDGVFSVGNIGDNTISISARSNSGVNVGMIMQELGGGGNQFSGATKIINSTSEEVGEKLKNILTPRYYNR
ncbi:MAG: DHH family phosphoesterase [Bacilli bacterium]|nr:DHH family phosphoesterase [Bacilli bacterium]